MTTSHQLHPPVSRCPVASRPPALSRRTPRTACHPLLPAIQARALHASLCCALCLEYIRTSQIWQLASRFADLTPRVCVHRMPPQQTNEVIAAGLLSTACARQHPPIKAPARPIRLLPCAP